MGCVLRVPHLLNRATRAKGSYATPYNPAYAGGGDTTLVDNRYAFKRGDDRAWQGFEGTDMDLMLDLGTVQPVAGVWVQFLQHMASTSVMLPTRLTVWTSENGTDFTMAVDREVEPDSNSEAVIRPFDLRLEAPVPARFVRLRATNRGILPEGHPRAGGSAWLFTDEVVVY